MLTKPDLHMQKSQEWLYVCWFVSWFVKLLRAVKLVLSAWNTNSYFLLKDHLWCKKPKQTENHSKRMEDIFNSVARISHFLVFIVLYGYWTKSIYIPNKHERKVFSCYVSKDKDYIEFCHNLYYIFFIKTIKSCRTWSQILTYTYI